MNNLLEKIILGIGAAFLFVFLAVINSLISAIILKLAWNHVMSYLFDFKIIDYWQAFAMTLIAGLLFKHKA